MNTLPVFDGHNDLLLRLWMYHRDAPAEAFFNGIPNGHLDYDRMRSGGFTGGMFAIFVLPPDRLAQMLPERAKLPYDPLSVMWEQFDILQQLIDASAGKMRLCRTGEEIAACREQGVIAAVAHIEGADALDEQGEGLQAFYQAGVRSIGPFWNLPNRFGTGISGSFPGSPDTGPGLTPAGERLIQQAAESGMIIDASHMNEKAFWDTARLTTQPLVATHSNAHALCAQPRNLTDEQLRAIRASKGIVGVNFGNAFLRADGQRTSDTPLEVIVQHIDHLIDVAGEEHVALGSDFDGISVPNDLGDVSGLPRLFAELRAAGYDQQTLEKLAWRNWQRIMNQLLR